MGNFAAGQVSNLPPMRVNVRENRLVNAARNAIIAMQKLQISITVTPEA